MPHFQTLDDIYFADFGTSNFTFDDDLQFTFEDDPQVRTAESVEQNTTTGFSAWDEENINPFRSDAGADGLEPMSGDYHTGGMGTITVNGASFDGDVPDLTAQEAGERGAIRPHTTP